MWKMNTVLWHFRILIHDNATLNDTQKLYYYYLALKGQATQVIQSLEIAENNLTIAWEFLKRRIENEKIIRNTHWK